MTRCNKIVDMEVKAEPSHYLYHHHHHHHRHQHQQCWCRAGDAAKMEGEWAISPLQFPVYPQNDDKCPKRPPACLLINTNTNTKDHELANSKIQIPKTQIEIQTCQENFWLIGHCVFQFLSWEEIKWISVFEGLSSSKSYFLQNRWWCAISPRNEWLRLCWCWPRYVDGRPRLLVCRLGHLAPGGDDEDAGGGPSQVPQVGNPDPFPGDDLWSQVRSSRDMGMSKAPIGTA